MLPSIIDVDSFFDPLWSPEFGDRAFRFDAFISHNRHDVHAEMLRKMLDRSGATVWYDDEQDLSDRRVQQRVSQALTQSRWVLVCVSGEFKDSAWCRAEYLPALEVERAAAGKRVLVASMTPTAPVPRALCGQPTFECHITEEIARLSAMLREGNRVPFPVEALRQADTYDLDTLLTEAKDWVSRKRSREDKKSCALFAVAHSLEDADSSMVTQMLALGRQILIESVEPTELSVEEHNFLVRASLFLCTARDSDNRANGMFMIQHLAKHAPSLHDAVLDVYVREPNDSLMQVGFPAFEEQWDMLTAQQRAIVERCAMRDPVHVRGSYANSAMVSEFSEVTRMKVFARGLSTNVLPCPERIHLLEERTTRIFENAESITGDAMIDRLRGHLHVPDIEIVFRDLEEILKDHGSHTREEWPDRPIAVAHLLGRIIYHSKEHQGFPVLDVEDKVHRFVLHPLLWSMSFEGARQTATTAIRDLCDVLDLDGGRRELVPIYREYLDIALRGADVSAGVNSSCFFATQRSFFRAIVKGTDGW
jgi:hypothetical protein